MTFVFPGGIADSCHALSPGASAGIGWAVCEALATAGLRVVAVARRRERLEQLQQTLVAAGVPIADFLPVVCDITKVRLIAQRRPACNGHAWFEDAAAASVSHVTISWRACPRPA